MSTKPVTEYYQHKYQDEILHKATIQSILDELNDMQRQVSEIKKDLHEITSAIDSTGQLLCNATMKSHRK